MIRLSLRLRRWVSGAGKPLREAGTRIIGAGQAMGKGRSALSQLTSSAGQAPGCNCICQRRRGQKALGGCRDSTRVSAGAGLLLFPPSNINSLQRDSLLPEPPGFSPGPGSHSAFRLVHCHVTDHMNPVVLHHLLCLGTSDVVTPPSNGWS